MPPALALFSRNPSAAPSKGWDRAAVAVLAALHLAAFAVLAWTEQDLVARLIFFLTWGLANCVWLVVLRRPAVSAGLSLIFVVVLILLSQFKQDVLLMSANFVDLMLIDTDTVSFLLTVFPSLRVTVAVTAAILLPLVVLLFWFDPYRVRRRAALLGAVTCLIGLGALALAVPMDRERAFESSDYVSQFARSAAVAMVDLATHGLMESDDLARGHLSTAAAANCQPGQRLPHVILVLDESSFDISAVPGIEVQPDYQNHFRSFDGKTRSLLVEGAGGPTWYTEYNVLTGLSARSYGRFAEFVTRISAGRITRSLPNALRPCGYRSYSLYPWLGAFLGARYFQKTLGIDHFLDAKSMGTRDIEPDEFYYNVTADLIRRESHGKPLFVLTYLMANHFPWSYRYREERVPDWRDLGNGDVAGNRIDEYLRRQEMSARDYRAFVARLRKDFPGEPFLIVRFGDHQPMFAKKIIDQKLSDAEIGRRIDAADPRFFTTYYAIDTVNFRPADLASAIDGLDASYLPLVVLEAAGVPLDPSFAEQKRILKACNGLFYLCASGAEVRRFNRLLIDAGLINRL
jgi:hypothetical protein